MCVYIYIYIYIHTSPITSEADIQDEKEKAEGPRSPLDNSYSY